MRKFNIWSVGSMLIVLMIMLPAYEIISNLFNAQTETWIHIKEHLMKNYIITSTLLVIGTVILSSLIAVSLAWFITIYEFPLSNYLKLAFVLPIAIPPYIGAYTYVGILGYTGSLQTFIRNTFNIQVNQKFFSITNLPGAIFIFSIFLYPYIYIACKAFLEKNSAQIIESGKLLGDNNLKVFFRLVLPLLRIPIVAGSTIVALDVLSDYAVVSYFGIGSFSAAIFKSWLNLQDIHSALKLSAILMIAVLLITTIEKYSRGSKKASFASTKVRPIRPEKLKGGKKIFVSIYSIIIICITLVIPVIQMIIWTVYSFDNISKKGLLKMAWNTVWLALISTTVIVILSLIVSNYKRLSGSFLSKILARLSIIGYSIPSAVIAISVLVLFLDLSPALSRTVIMIMFAYIVRYFTISYQNLDSGFEKVGMDFHNSSRTLGNSSLKTFFLVDIPMIKPAIIGAFILTFVDIAKELTITLILRPFNFYTLSTKVFEYAHDEMIPESSPASLLIIAISTIPVLIYHNSNRKRDE